MCPRPLSDRNSCAVANGSTSVPEVLAPAKLESIVAVVVVVLLLSPAARRVTVYTKHQLTLILQKR